MSGEHIHTLMVEVEQDLSRVGLQFGTDLQLLNDLLREMYQSRLSASAQEIEVLRRRIDVAEQARQEELAELRHLQQERAQYESAFDSFAQELNQHVIEAQPDPETPVLRCLTDRLSSYVSAPVAETPTVVKAPKSEQPLATLAVGDLVHLLNGEGSKGQILTTEPVPILGFVSDEQTGRYIQYPNGVGLVMYWPVGWCELALRHGSAERNDPEASPTIVGKQVA